MSDEQIDGLTDWAKANEAEELPQIILPSGGVTITDCAARLFGLIAPTRRLFVRGGAVMSLVRCDDGQWALEVLGPAAARSFFEKFGHLFAWRVMGGAPVLKEVNCPQEMADALLQSEEAAQLLPRVQGLMNCPILQEVDGQLVVAGGGYDEHSRQLVTGGEMPPVVEFPEAVDALLALFVETNYQTPGDAARAMASLISPGLSAGGFISGRVPADVAEADQSQAGKTYRQRVIAAIYNEKPSLVTCRQGGVGSVDESLDRALISGRRFIQLDNFRGRFESAHLEGFMTADGTFYCRVPYRGAVGVPPESYFVMLTSNGVNTTRDLANRSNIIRIKKHPDGFQFTKFPEGDLLQRVRHWQAYYLGCVFSVIREWHARGMPRTEETRHDFRAWVQVVDWICQNLLGTVPVMEGHQQAQERVSNPALVWLRSLVLAINEAGELNHRLTATKLFELCEASDIAVPGLGAGASEDKGKKTIGSIMGKLFRDQNILDMEGFVVTREERSVSRENSLDGGSFKSKFYTVAKK